MKKQHGFILAPILVGLGVFVLLVVMIHSQVQMKVLSVKRLQAQVDVRTEAWENMREAIDSIDKILSQEYSEDDLKQLILETKESEDFLWKVNHVSQGLSLKQMDEDSAKAFYFLLLKSGMSKKDALKASRKIQMRSLQEGVFESIQELTYVAGLAKDEFEYLKDHISLFVPVSERINIQTVHPDVLLSTAQAKMSDVDDSEQMEVANRLVEKLIRFRNGDDRKPQTRDDQNINWIHDTVQRMGLSRQETALFQKMRKFYIEKPRYVKIESFTSQKHKNEFKLESIYDLKEKRIVHLEWD